MNDSGIPETSGERLNTADWIVSRLCEMGIPREDIFFDPLVQPISVSSAYGTETLRTIKDIMEKHQGVHTICGLSNVSFGLPNRRLLNRAFLVMAMAYGLDGVILNPLDEETMSLLRATEALAGRDDYCLEYLKIFGKQRVLAIPI